MTTSRIAALIAIGLAVALLGDAYGHLRVAIGGAVFLFLTSFAFKYWRAVGLIPPETETHDVSDQDLRYVCTMCGLELRVEVAARDKAPTHCAEPMKLLTGPGSTPLRPV
jgi:hypothetical protein